MHWHCPLWAPPTLVATSRESLPCSCSICEVCYALHLKYPSLLLNSNNWHMFPLKLLVRNPFLFWCFPNPYYVSPCYWSLSSCLEFYQYLAYPITMLWASTPSPKPPVDSKQIYPSPLWSTYIWSLIRKSKQNICHLYIVFCCLLKHSSSSSMVIQFYLYPLHRPWCMKPRNLTFGTCI